MIPVETWALTGTAAALAWSSRRTVASVLVDGRVRFRAGQAGSDTPRRARAVELPDGVRDHEVLGWLAGDPQPSPITTGAPREAARPYLRPTPMTDCRRSQ